MFSEYFGKYPVQARRICFKKSNVADCSTCVNAHDHEVLYSVLKYLETYLAHFFSVG